MFFNSNIFSNRLRMLRKQHELTLEELGAQLNSSKGTLANLENAKKNPSVDMLIKLADFFDVSVDYLIGRSDNPKRL